MQKRILFAVVSFLFLLNGVSQIDVGGFLKDRDVKAKAKVKEKTTEIWEKNQKEYDASNFNYAISFIDNSGLFEAEEKRGTFISNLLSVANFANNKEISKEDRAYTNLKNRELLMAGNKFNLAEQSFKQAKDHNEKAGKDTSENYAQTISNVALVYQSSGRYNKSKSFSEDAVLKKETGCYTEAES